MATLKDIDIRYSYTGNGTGILKDFLLPALEVSNNYDRVTSYFTVDSLLAISQGIESLYERCGRMRLIIGVHSFPGDLADAVTMKEHIKNEIERIRHDIQIGLATITSELERKRVATLAWMIEDELLSVKVASVKGEGIFHPKTLILKDYAGNCVAAIGSPNETASGLGGNFEQLLVLPSWLMSDAVDDQIRFFDSLWANEDDDAEVVEISAGLANDIYRGLGNEYRKPEEGRKTVKVGKGAFAVASKMPANFFVSGDIPALFQHQERAVIDALSRWPVRVLFGDEVGLGKTFEAAATMAFLVKYCGVRRVLILTPKAVLQQWQDELIEHFGINAWLYDSASKSYMDSNGAAKKIGNANPIGKNSPDVMLMSAQYARGGAERKSIFERSGAVLPDLLVVDEAHSARISKDISGGRKVTRMYRMLESVVRQIPHVVFATATPMQRDAAEYHAMLKLIGLPKTWLKERSYLTSLKLVISDDVPDASDANLAGKLLRSTVRMMKPSLANLEQGEREALLGLMGMDDECPKYQVVMYVQDNWQALRRVFVKLHPAHLLTVRNTRRALTEMGYVFPERNLHEEDVPNSDEVRLFYMKVNDYITHDCFSVEKVLDPERTISIGFVRVSYQQRVASSLYSCKRSLERRLEKIMALDNRLKNEGILPKVDLGDFATALTLDDIDDDEMFATGSATADDFGFADGVDLGALAHAIAIESTSLPALISQVNGLLAAEADLKVKRSIELAQKHLAQGDKVLLFSRYTDTVDALIGEFNRVGGAHETVYGIYVGQKSAIIYGDNETPCTKRDIKEHLATGDLRLMFCSDAASEGLNLQAARVLINVDVPWTPSRLEQRIGRVARLGQRAESVDVYNVWYPDSIEAKMYRRINKRLKEANIAVGEFPDVVAEGIKNVVLEDREQEDDSLRVLQEIRNSVQTKALSELWSSSGEGETTSSYIRSRLIALCDKEFDLVTSTEDGSLRVYSLPSGNVALSALDGMTESVSLKSEPWNYVNYDLTDYGYLDDSLGNPCVFVKKDDSSSLVNQEFIVDLASGEPLSPDAFDNSHPNMLADTSSLSLDYAIDCNAPDKPEFWPPV